MYKFLDKTSTISRYTIDPDGLCTLTLTMMNVGTTSFYGMIDIDLNFLYDGVVYVLDLNVLIEDE